MAERVIVLPGGVVKEMVPVRDWHYGFNWRDLRIGVSFQPSMWEFNLPGFCVWCERYERHGDEITEIPSTATIIAHPNTRLSDLQAVGATVSFVRTQRPVCMFKTAHPRASRFPFGRSS